MKIHLLRLESSIEDGVGGPEAGLIDLIYTYLLHKFGLNAYSYIHIHQIGDDLEEIIKKDRRNIYINIRYTEYSDFASKSVDQRNHIRLTVVHQALLRIADYENKLDKDKLEMIKNLILEKEFNFEIPYKETKNKVMTDKVAKILISPSNFDFKFYLDIFDGDRRKCRILIYKGATVPIYFDDLFSICRWESSDRVLVTGKRSDMEIKISDDNCRVEYIIKNRSQNQAPYFELFKSDSDKKIALEDYIHSLNPSIAAIITNNAN